MDWLTDLVVDFFHSRLVAIVLSLTVAGCCAYLAFCFGHEMYGLTYGILFAVVSLALTLHYAKMIPDVVLDVVRGITVGGLVLSAVFIGVSALLSSGVPDEPAELSATKDRVERLKGDIGITQGIAKSLAEQGQGTNANKMLSSREYKALQDRLSKAEDRVEELEKDNNPYTTGNLILFGHIQAMTGAKQEAVDTIIGNLFLLIIVCVDLTMGAYITTRREEEYEHEEEEEEGEVEEGAEEHSPTEELESNVVDFSPDQPRPVQTVDQTAPDECKEELIISYVLDTDQPISTGLVSRKFETGKEKVNDIYLMLQSEGYLAKDGPGKQWTRTGKKSWRKAV